MNVKELIAKLNRFPEDANVDIAFQECNCLDDVAIDDFVVLYNEEHNTVSFDIGYLG